MSTIDELMGVLGAHLDVLYPSEDTASLAKQVATAFFGEDLPLQDSVNQQPLWSQQDVLMITYGNTLEDGIRPPLAVLHDFLQRHLQGVVSGVHILPFFPWSSDDGFSVIDYDRVDSKLGDWDNVSAIADDFNLMADLVLNHGSSYSSWFAAFLNGQEPYDKFYKTADPDKDDLSQVVRPRPWPLLREVETPKGTKHVWCTFSHDQVDFDFGNPDVLIEFVKILRLYIEKGARYLRLDAVAFMWKQPGTTSLHLPETHEAVRLFRSLLDWQGLGVKLITETNVPNSENLTYFGNQNEAHIIYNFSLPPLLLHGMMNGTSQFLKQWMMSMPPAIGDCAYLNFTASHDGIGVRPAEGLLPQAEIDSMIDMVKTLGGRVSTRALPDGGEKPYEMNIALFDAMKGRMDDADDGHQVARFLCSQTIMMALEGIPAFYIHSLLATPNYQDGVEKYGHNRAINRQRLRLPELEMKLMDSTQPHGRILEEIKRLISIRRFQPAFHPNATQFTLHLGDSLFGFWRQSLDRSQSIFSIHNMTAETQTLSLTSLNLITGEGWQDLITGKRLDDRAADIVMQPYQSLWISNRD